MGAFNLKKKIPWVPVLGMRDTASGSHVCVRCASTATRGPAMHCALQEGATRPRPRSRARVCGRPGTSKPNGESACGRGEESPLGSADFGTRAGSAENLRGSTSARSRTLRSVRVRATATRRPARTSGCQNSRVPPTTGPASRN